MASYFDGAASEYGAAESFGPLVRSAPAADATAFFTGFTASTSSDAGCAEEPSVEVVDGANQLRGAVVGCTAWVTTDPRINGESVSIANADKHPTARGVPGGTVLSARGRIVNESGSWEGTLSGVTVDGKPSLMSGWYAGGGAYEGLMAYVTLQNEGESLWGYISLEPPPIPRAVPER